MATTDASRPLDPLLRPSRLAVVGASSDPTKRGYQVLRSLETAGYAGEVIPVNPRGGRIRGREVVPSVAELPPGVDLALVCTPASTIPSVLEGCGAAGVRSAVLLAVGFAESGAEGERLEARVRELARETGVRVLGPNTSGLLNLPHGLNLLGLPGVPAGPVGVLAQSGNLLLSLLLPATRGHGPGVSVAVGVGNQVDVGFPELLDFLRTDPATRVVLIHAEGIPDGPAFLAAAARTTPVKPVVLLKGGRSASGERAARSHTGAVSGPHDVLAVALRQAGVVEVTRSDELLAVGQALALPTEVPGDAGDVASGLAVLTDGGGQGALAADAMAEAGVPLADLAPATRDALRSLLGPAAALGNPVDLAGSADADPRVFPRALELLARDPAVVAVLVVGLFGGYALRFASELAEAETAAAREMARVAADAALPVVVHTMYGELDPPPLVALREAGIPVVASLEVACRAAGVCVGRILGRGTEIPGREPWRPDPRLRPVREGGPAVVLLDEPSARERLRERGVEPAPARLCRTEEEAVVAAGDGPVAVRLVARGVAHKTEVGGVALGVRGGRAVVEAFRRVVAAGARAAGASVEGALVGPMLPRPGAELLVGVRRDPVWGATLTAGAGGVQVEVLRDVAHRVLPLGGGERGRRERLDLLEELRIAPILAGVRGAPPLDVAGVADVMQALEGWILADRELVEAEINPLFVYEDRVVPVDVRVFLRETARG